MVKDKTLFGYLTSKLVVISSIFPFVISGITYIRTKALYESLTILLTSIIIIIIILFNKTYKNYITLKRSHEKLKEDYEDLSKKHLNMALDFINQSKQYDKNIDELNLHKQVTSMISVLVRGKSPDTKEAKELINLLELSIEKIAESSDKDDL